MDRILLPVILTAMVLLPGCLGTPPAAAPRDDDQAPADTLAWGLTACRYVVAWGYVDGDAVEPFLPEGMSVRRSTDAFPPDPGGDTLFGADAMACGSGMGLEDEVAPLGYGYVWAAADPPEAWLQEGVDPDEHYAKWDVLVPDAPRREALAARGVPVHDGAATVDDAPMGPDATVAYDGLGTLRIQGLTTRPIGAFDGAFVKMSEAEDGAVAWRAQATSGPRTTGHALMTFPEGSWMADVVGDTTLRGGYHAGTWSYDEARLVFLDSVPAAD